MNFSNPIGNRVPRLFLATSLLFAVGCGGSEPSRGAGSIDIPEAALKKFSFEKPAPKGKNASRSASASRTTQ